MFIRMLKLPEEVRNRYDLSSQRRVTHAAAPCPVHVKEQMIEWWGPIIDEYYAGTENIGSTSINSVDWLAHKGSVGRALNAVIHICGDDGEEVPIGETGAVYFETEAAAFEYHGDTTKTNSVQHPAPPDLALPGGHRTGRRGRVPLSHRPPRLHDRLGRGEHLSPGDRGRVVGPSRRSSTPPSSGCPMPTWAKRSRRWSSRSPGSSPATTSPPNCSRGARAGWPATSGRGASISTRSCHASTTGSSTRRPCETATGKGETHPGSLSGPAGWWELRAQRVRCTGTLE